MDWVFFEICALCYKDYADKKVGQPFSKDNLSLLIEYHEYLKRSAFSNDNLVERTYQNKLLKRMADKEPEDNARLVILDKAMKLYFELVRTKEKSDKSKFQYNS
jgi:hypothetical protein